MSGYDEYVVPTEESSAQEINGDDMSDVINDRERGEERKFQMDQETQFKAEARRNKLLGSLVSRSFRHGPGRNRRVCQGCGHGRLG